MKSPNASPNVETTADAIFLMGVEVPVTAAQDSRAKIRNAFTPVPLRAKAEALNVESSVAKFVEFVKETTDVKTADVSASQFAAREVVGNPMVAGVSVNVRIVEMASWILANYATAIAPKTAMTIMLAPSAVSPANLKIVMLNATTQPSKSAKVTTAAALTDAIPSPTMTARLSAETVSSKRERPATGIALIPAQTKIAAPPTA